MLACSSPGRFAARCVLLRPLTPRHPPCALLRLTAKLFVITLFSLCSFQGANGGLRWIRTTDLTLIRRALSPTELQAHTIYNGGDEEIRTPDPLRARQVLSQLSYTPIKQRENDLSKLNSVMP
jgi:hypothetical protein